MSSMCGIIDFEKSGVDFSTLREMGRAMILRGQDQSGAYLNGGIGLYHNRCIIGEPEQAREPYTVSRNGKNYTVCFDGELKNCRGQNGDFDLLDFESAAQAVAESYLTLGADLFSCLSGDYAFALCDEYRGEVLLARDPGGKKPLYYTFEEGVLRFASEIKGMLRAHEDLPAISTQKLTTHLLSPVGSCTAKDFYPGIREVAPGECVVFSRVGMTGFRIVPPTYEEAQEEGVEPVLLRLQEADDLAQELNEILIAFDYPQFDAWMPGLLAELRACRARQKRTLLFEDSTLCQSISYARERADRLGMFYGVCAEGVAPAEHESPEKRFRGLEQRLWELTESCDRKELRRLYGDGILAVVKREKSTVKRIRMLGILCQTLMWLERYPLLLTTPANEAG